MDEAEELRDRAIRWRSISLFQTDQMARDALASIAEELERRATQLEAEQPPLEPQWHNPR